MTERERENHSIVGAKSGGCEKQSGIKDPNRAVESILTAHAKAWLQELPEHFRATVEGITRDILTNHPDTLAGVVVGSLAEGVFDRFSDVDYLYVKDPMIPDDAIIQIRARWPLSHFIVHSPENLERHFDNCSTMAWAIKKGVVIFDRNNLLDPFMQRRLEMPSREWMRSRLEYVGGWDEDSRGLCHKMLELGTLYLEILGVAPTTKHELRSEFLGRVKNEALTEAMGIATERGTEKSALLEIQLQSLKKAVEILREKIEASLF